MLGLETLYSVRRHLQKREQRSDAASLRQLFRELYESPRYQEWLAGDQFFGASDARSRFRVPAGFGKGHGETKWLLERYGFVNGDVLTVKIDDHEGRIHLTDGNWVPAEYRVYPFSDESHDIVEHVKGSGLDREAQILVDPACGCGHHALGLADIPVKVNFDVNPRALELAKINCILAGVDSMFCAENDIRGGMADHVDYLSVDRILITINMPFAIFPALRKGPDAPKPAQDGGRRGMELTEKAIEAIAGLCGNSRSRSVVGVVLAYSLGDPDKNRWDILEVAKRYLGDAKTNFKLLSHRKMWRVSGRKEQPNPMPVQSLALKAGCIHTYGDEQRANRGVL